MEAILLLLSLVIILGTTWFVVAIRKDRRDQSANRVPTDLTNHTHRPADEHLNPMAGGPGILVDPYQMGHPGRDTNEASYKGIEYHKEENLGDLPWD